MADCDILRRAIYREDGGEYLVEVLSDETAPNDEGETFRTVGLRCLSTIRPSPLIGSITPGDEWDAMYNVEYPGLCWSLDYETNSRGGDG